MSLSSYYIIILTRVKFLQADDRKRKRKRSQDDENPLYSTTIPSLKRPRASSPRHPLENTISENITVGASGKEISPLEY